MASFAEFLCDELPTVTIFIVSSILLNAVLLIRSFRLIIWKLYTYLIAIITFKFKRSVKEKHRYKRGSNDLETKDCIICLSEFKNGVEIRELICNHVFHFVCLKEWLRHQPATCPLCRNRAPIEDFGTEEEEEEESEPPIQQRRGFEAELIGYLSALQERHLYIKP
ncbi:zinc finger protein [Macleaya cordata]|uniref:Zinc finger protein n=1 Tax=Macleaya cordata TaxID=56857 RepID=A0A200Q541_MACCD|nr:zinc finger protein [Macleaya cordata]